MKILLFVLLSLNVTVEPTDYRDAVIQTLASLPRINSSPVTVVVMSPKEWELVQHYQKIDGIYFRDKSIIYLPSGRGFGQTLTHEFGHHVYYQLTPSQKQQWQAFWEENRPYFPRFGRVNAREGWAWAYQYVFTDRPLDKRIREKLTSICRP